MLFFNRVHKVCALIMTVNRDLPRKKLQCGAVAKHQRIIVVSYISKTTTNIKQD